MRSGLPEVSKAAQDAGDKYREGFKSGIGDGSQTLTTAIVDRLRTGIPDVGRAGGDAGTEYGRRFGAGALEDGDKVGDDLSNSLTSGISQNLGREITAAMRGAEADIEKAAKDAGDKYREAFKASIGGGGRTLTSGIVDNLRTGLPDIGRVGREAGEEFQRGFDGEGTGNRMGDDLITGLRDAAARGVPDVNGILGNIGPAGGGRGGGLGGGGGDSGGALGFLTGNDGRGDAAGKALRSVALAVDGLAAAIAPVLGAVGALAGGLFALGTAAAQASGALIVIPAVFGAIIQSSIVSQFAFKGVGDALTASADIAGKTGDELVAATEKYEAALKKLPVPAQEFVRYLISIQDQLKVLREAAGVELFPKLITGIQQVIDSGFVDILEAGFQRTGSAIGNVSLSLADLASDPFFQGNFASVMEQNASLTETLGQAAVNLAGFFAALLVAADPVIQRFQNFALSVSEAALASLSTQEQIDNMSGKFERSGDAAGKLFELISNLFVGIGNLGRAANPAGQGLLDSLIGVTGQLAAMDDAASQTKLKDYFDAVGEATKRIGTVFQELGGYILGLGANDNVAGFAEQLSGELLPAIEELLDHAITQSPVLVSALTDIVHGFTALSETGALEIFVGVLASFADVIVSALGNPIIGPLLTNLVLLEAGIAAFTIIRNFSGIGFLVSGLTNLYGVIPKNIKELKDLVTATKASVAAYLTKARIIVQTTVATIAHTTAVVAQGVAMRVSAVAARALGIAMSLSLGQVGLIIAGVSLLAAGFVALYRRSETFRNIIDGIGAVAQKVFGAVAGYIKNIFTNPGETLKQTGKFLLDGLILGLTNFNPITILTKISDLLIGGFKAIFGISSPSTVFAELGGFLVAGLVQGLQGIGSAVLSALSGLGGIVATAFGGVLGAVTGALGAVGRFIAGNWQGILLLLTGPLGAVVVLVATHWETIKTTIGAAIDAVVGFIVGFATRIAGFGAGVFDTVVAGALALREKVAAAFDAVLAVVSAVAGAIAGFAFGLWDSYVTGVTTVYTAVLAAFTAVRETVAGVVGALVTFAVGLWDAYVTGVVFLAAKVYEVWTGIRAYIAEKVAELTAFATGLWETYVLGLTTLYTRVLEVWAAVKEYIGGKVAELVAFATGLWETYVLGLTVLYNRILEIWAAVKEYVGGKVAELVAFAAGLWEAYVLGLTTLYDRILNVWETIKAYIAKKVDEVKEFGRFIFDTYKEAATAAYDWLVQKFVDIILTVRGVKARVEEALGDYLQVVRDKIDQAKQWFSDRIDETILIVKLIKQRVDSAIGDVFQIIRTKISEAKQWVSDRFDDVIALVGGLITRVNGAIGDVFKIIRTKISEAKQWVSDRFDDVIALVGGLITRVNGAIGDIFGVFGRKATALQNSMKSFFSSIVTDIVSIWNTLPDKLGRGAATIAGKINQYLVRPLNAVTSKFDLNIPEIKIPGFATGGPVRGPGGPKADKIPAMLSDGEYVINAAATKRNRRLLDQINASTSSGGAPRVRQTSADGVQRFAGGGFVGGKFSAGKTQPDSTLGAAITSKIAGWLSTGIGFALEKIIKPVADSFADKTDFPSQLANKTLLKFVDKAKEWGSTKDNPLGSNEGPGGASSYTGGSGGRRSNSDLIALGRFFQGLGARVTEHPAFNGGRNITSGHSRGSDHYKRGGGAIDLNYGPGGQNATEMAFFDKWAKYVRSQGFKTLWRVKGHFNHLHAAFDSGGVANGLGYMPKKTLRPERVLSPQQTEAFDRLVGLLTKNKFQLEKLTNIGHQLEAARQTEALRDVVKQIQARQAYQADLVNQQKALYRQRDEEVARAAASLNRATDRTQPSANPASATSAVGSEERGTRIVQYITNNFPVAEATSVTTNRALQYAAALGGL